MLCRTAESAVITPTTENTPIDTPNTVSADRNRFAPSELRESSNRSCQRIVRRLDTALFMAQSGCRIETRRIERGHDTG